MKSTFNHFAMKSRIFTIMFGISFVQFLHFHQSHLKIKSQPIKGKVATYIPQLGKVNPELFAISICTVDGRVFSIGDLAVPFCLQSCSKAITYLLACEMLGQDHVHKYVGKEPSGVVCFCFFFNGVIDFLSGVQSIFTQF